ncbi:mucin-2-like [Solenopsis invicta]|uniref:mucin-2-like n=1 Tax=Solenopsis invicta TaxID=13686 RepID=UPI0005962317|nr:mucin-2-like [Solenopsis invicta]
MIETTPSSPGLFPSPPQRRTEPGPNWNIAAASDQPTTTGLPSIATNSPAPAKPPRAKPVLAIRAPPQGLMQGAKPAKRLTSRPAPKRPPPLVCGSSDPPQLTQESGPHSWPSHSCQATTSGKATHEEEPTIRTPATTSCEPPPLPATRPGHTTRPTTADPHAVTNAPRKVVNPPLPAITRGTETKSTGGPAPCSDAANAPPEETTVEFPTGVSPSAVTRGARTTATAPSDGEATALVQPAHTHRTGIRPERPPIPVRVKDDLTVYVQCFALMPGPRYPGSIRSASPTAASTFVSDETASATRCVVAKVRYSQGGAGVM